MVVCISEGLLVYGLKGVGEGKDFLVFEVLIWVIDKLDDWLFWVLIWGGFGVFV